MRIVEKSWKWTQKAGTVVTDGLSAMKKQYAENFKTYYKFVREHQELKMTPAQRVKINESNLWKELLEKSAKTN